MGAILVGLLLQMVSGVGGLFGGLFNFVKGGIGQAWSAARQYNQEGIAFGRQMGLSLREANAYTEVLVNRASKLGMAYGLSAKQVMELQTNLANASGRALMLNDQEAERMVQLNKVVGANTVNAFTTEMMTHMGGQLSAVQGAVSKAYAIGAKSGLNAAKFSEAVAKNLGLANKLSFRNGVEGIMRMTALSEKLGFNLQSVEQAANSFMELDKSIENAAKLQMLGGAAAAYGSNPLTMAYEANYDPEAFGERMTNALKGLATFDASKGVAEVNGMNRDFVKNIAQAMGISMDEAMSIAKKQAEVGYKENAYASTLGRFSKEQQDFIINKSYVDPTSGHLMMNDVRGNQVDLSKVNPNDIGAIVQELSKFDNKSELDIMTMQAQSLTSMDEKFKGIETSYEAKIANPIIESIDDINKLVNWIGNFIVNTVGERMKTFIEAAFGWVIDNRTIIKTSLTNISKVINGIFSFARENWNWLRPTLIGIGAAIAGWKAYQFGRNTMAVGKRVMRRFNRGYRGAARAARNTANGARDIGSYGRYARSEYQYLRGQGNGRFSSIRNAFASPTLRNGVRGTTNIASANSGQILGRLGNTTREASAAANSALRGSRLVSTIGKGLLKGGGLGIVGALGNMGTDALVNNGTIERGGAAHIVGSTLSTAAEMASLGAMIGTIIPGVGTAIGGAIGGLGGAIYGAIDAATSQAEPHANGGIVGGNSYNGDKILARVNSGEMILNQEQQAKLLRMISYNSEMSNGVMSTLKNSNEMVKAKPVGDKEYIYAPRQVGGNKVTEVSVKDINVNISGTIKLDGGNGNSKGLDVAKLLADSSFVSSLKDLIKESINNDLNNGRFMNDVASMRGMPTPMGLWGR